ncbi:WD repeat-containing protein 75 [Thelohanellus kitauei]|uniref:WD repeat-containing protein 75 n=1 Tax=Thelohanellus kitauei TaxID=669202 RepID=A0A0C2MPW2_THEKT|nr:WD repeat-containing protein 75 [Thelohanellus kitauei]
MLVFNCGIHGGVYKNYKYKICKTNNHDISLTTVGYSRLANRKNCAYSYVEKCLITLDMQKIRTFHLGDKTTKSVVVCQVQPCCVATHPIESHYAVAFTNGMIELRYISDHVVMKNLHWHSNPVSDVTFSDEGSHLFSAGFEAVLVAWDLINQKESFLPRLGDQIKFLTCSESYICMIHTNNQISIADKFNFDLKARILDFQTDNRILAWDNRSETLLMPGSVGFINFYSPSISKTVYSLEVVQQNFIGGFKKMLQATQYNVTHIISSRDNRFLYTVEQTVKFELSRLKIWFISDIDHKYKLKCCLESLHCSKINDIFAYLESGDLEVIVTSGGDLKIKFWQIQEVDNEKFATSLLNELSVTEEPIMMRSNDKIMVVVYKRRAEFYNLQHLQKIDEIHMYDIRDMAFIPAEQHKVLVLLDKYVSLYDTKDLKFLWTEFVVPQCFAVDPISSNICIFGNYSRDGTGPEYLGVHQAEDFRLLQKIELGMNKNIHSCVIGNKIINQQELRFASQIFFSTPTGVFLISGEDIKLRNYEENLRKSTQNVVVEFENKLRVTKPFLMKKYSAAEREKEFLKMIKLDDNSFLLPLKNLVDNYLDIVCYFENQDHKLPEPIISQDKNPPSRSRNVQPKKTEVKDFNSKFRKSLDLKFNEAQGVFE